MLAATHLDNYLFLLFVVVALLFQLLTRAATKSGRKTGGDLKRRSTSTPQTPRSTTTEAEQSDEDQIRKFLEALGQPTTSKPPPPVGPRPTYQRPVVFPAPMKSPLPPLKTRPPDSPMQTPTPVQMASKPERKVYKPKVAETAAFEVHQGPPALEPITEPEARTAFQPTAPISKQIEQKIDLATMLRSSTGLRDAIILREIFGPPRSLQPLDLVGTV